MAVQARNAVPRVEINERPTFPAIRSPKRRVGAGKVGEAGLTQRQALAYLHGIKEIGTTLTALEGLQSKRKTLWVSLSLGRRINDTVNGV